MNALGFLVLAIWLALVFARGGFWLCRDRDDVAMPTPPTPKSWPRVAAVIPARDEADVIATSIGSLLAQDYPGDFRNELVDDQSSDGTAKAAQACAAASASPERLTVLTGAPLPSGWAGKLWAVSQGIKFAEMNFAPDYLLLTDADIAHAPDNLRALVSRAEQGGYGLVSLMALLRCESPAEKLLVPAFVYFFQMLYPFRWVSDPRKKLAGAAGGCMLVRADLLARAGGVQAIAGALIDDCALGERMKKVGPIWLGLTKRVVSLRPYPHFQDIRKMVARSAYAQLHYSPLLLVGALAGMVLTYFAPLWLALFGEGAARACGLAAFALMSLTFWPIQRFYGLSSARALTLPLIAALYMVYTLDSAVQFFRGRGGMWKGRAQAHRTEGA
ncbi:glycosyltransferase [Rhodoblastus sp.]|uniref:glycosyltransferase n=1 Tax=Rhodoblastus sp. TaxID=1962975 RepID=UPI003F982E7A